MAANNSSSSGFAGKKIPIISSDGNEFLIDESIAFQFQKIKHLCKDVRNDDEPILIPNVNGKILSKVIEYCQKRVDSGAVDDELKAFDADFVKVDNATLSDLILAADSLGITQLMDLAFKTVANMIHGKTPEYVRRLFNIKNDFTPEEERELLGLSNFE